MLYKLTRRNSINALSLDSSFTPEEYLEEREETGVYFLLLHSSLTFCVIPNPKTLDSHFRHGSICQNKHFGILYYATDYTFRPHPLTAYYVTQQTRIA